MSDINHLLQRLCDADVEFIIVGGFAAMLHGSSLLTRDLVQLRAIREKLRQP